MTKKLDIDPKEFEEDNHIRKSLINLVKSQNFEAADELVKNSYIGRQAKRIELNFFYNAIKMNLDITRNVEPSRYEP